MKILLSVLFCFSFLLTEAQTEEDAWVFFTDKPNVEDQLGNPLHILTQRAIDRKNRHNIAIDEKDIPVDENYISSIKETQGLQVLAKSKWFNCVFVRGGENVIRNLEELDFVSAIQFANRGLNDFTRRKDKPAFSEKKVKQRKFSVQNTEDFDYGAAEDQITQLQADFLHQQGFSGENIWIAVMDSGFPQVNTLDAFKKAREEGRILDGYDFVDRQEDEFAFQNNNHGTLTFSNIAGNIDNEFVGTAPDATYILFRTEDVFSEGPKEEALWVEAVERADSLGVDVINTSLGYSDGFDNPAYNYLPSDMDGQTTFISRGANVAFEKGMMIVNSAGNSGNSTWNIVTAPGDAPGALTVGAIDSNGNYASFSSEGPSSDGRIKPDVVARGVQAAVISTSGTIASANGTSFSSPIMAGAVACLWQAFPDKTNAELMEMIRASAHLFSTPNNQLGYGIPNFRNILDTLSNTEVKNNQTKIFPNPIENEIKISGLDEINKKIKFYSLDGRLMYTDEFQSTNLEVSFLSPGVYILELEANEIVITEKIIKR